MDVADQAVTDVRGLLGQALLKVVLLTPQVAYLVFVEIQLLGQGFDSFLKSIDLSLERRLVEARVICKGQSG